MGYAAIVLAVTGLCLGSLFRLKVLFPALAMVLIGSVTYSIAGNFDFIQAAGAVMAAQAIIQSGYFVGAVLRHMATGNQRLRTLL